MEQLAQIEESMKLLWDKAKQAGDLINRLRDEKLELKLQVDGLQTEVTRLRSELAAKEQHVQTLATAQIASEAKSGGIISNGERDALAAKVKELLTRIDGYL